MPRADAERVAAWEAMRHAVALVTRDLEAGLEEQRHQEFSTYTTLDALVAAGGRIRMHELADLLVLGRPTVTRMVDRLETSGFVERERLEHDGRAVHVVLTRAGREEYRRCQPAYERFVNDSFGRLLTDADVAAITRATAKLLA